jgi:hypothetical protein
MLYLNFTDSVESNNISLPLSPKAKVTKILFIQQVRRIFAAVSNGATLLCNKANHPMTNPFQRAALTVTSEVKGTAKLRTAQLSSLCGFLQL